MKDGGVDAARVAVFAGGGIAIVDRHQAHAGPGRARGGIVRVCARKKLAAVAEPVVVGISAPQFVRASQNWPSPTHPGNWSLSLSPGAEAGFEGSVPAADSAALGNPSWSGSPEPFCASEPKYCNSQASGNASPSMSPGTERRWWGSIRPGIPPGC